MGSTLTKLTTNNVQLNESNVSDIVIYEQQVKKDKDKSPQTEATKSGLFKNIYLNLDPRSPSNFITRTPIAIFRSASNSKFNHQELNESLNESVDIDILTAEEKDSLDNNKDLVDAIENNEVNNDEAKDDVEPEKLDDPRSPITEITRTPILVIDDVKKVDNNLMRKITDKLMSTKINADDDEQLKKIAKEITKKKSKATEKNLIFKDDEIENFDRFSTPPKKLNTNKENERTPLSCVANKPQNNQRSLMLTSTPKGSKIPVYRERSASSRIPRRIE